MAKRKPETKPAPAKPGQWRHVRLAAGATPGTFTIVTEYLGNPVGDLVLKHFNLKPGDTCTTYNLPPAQAQAMATRVDTWIESQRVRR